MPRGRIGLSLDEDVLAILNEYGRGEKLRPGATAEDVREWLADGGSASGHIITDTQLVAYLSRPTRTEIAQTAIREWAARQDERDTRSPSRIASEEQDPSWSPDAESVENAAKAGCHHLARYRVGQMCTACGVVL